MFIRSDDPQPKSTACSHVEEAIILKKNYKGMLLQGDEVDHRIQLWRDAIQICKVDRMHSECTSSMRN
jgi:hypothetical protein